MTILLVDIASYQGGLRLADVRRAGFHAVNFKTSHGLALGPAKLPYGELSEPRKLRVGTVHPNVAGLAAEAKSLGLGVGTFHWLVGNHPGFDQANHAYAQLRELGLDMGAAHTVDVEEQADADTEDPPNWYTVSDYVHRMQQLLHRPVMIYTGDWWWTAPGRGWDGATLTPYLMAAPNDGYPGTYPGDTSPKWRAGYGGWTNLSVMQYAVEPLRFPDGTAGRIKVSKSAVRDDAVWDVLTGEGQSMTGFTSAEVAAALRAALGPRAAEVGRLLTGGQP